MSKKIIGIDLGGTSIKFAILTSEGEIQEKWSIKTNILDEGSHTTTACPWARAWRTARRWQPSKGRAPCAGGSKNQRLDEKSASGEAL